MFFFFFKQKTAYEISVRDWSSDVCSSDQIGRAHVSTPVTNAYLVCRIIRSEEHTSELQSRTLISYAVFCLKKKKSQHYNTYGVICYYKKNRNKNHVYR